MSEEFTPRPEKVAVVEEITGKLGAADAVFVTAGACPPLATS